jgi:thymidylate synthase ThyX
MANVTLISETKKGQKPLIEEINKIIAESNGDSVKVAEYFDELYDMNPEQLASNAGRACYESEMPAMDKEKIKVKERLFDTGHHTTIEHSYFTFAIDDISVSTITFGMHLAHPFYNSDQRSGRYSKMYDEPDMGEISRRVETYSLQGCDGFPSMNVGQVMDFVGYGLNVFGDNKEKLTDIAADVLRRERPNVSGKYIEQNAKKMAQEQLRVFVSTIAPTGMYHTVDLAALAALFRVAWTPEMRQTVNLMKDSVLTNHPNIAYMFDEDKALWREYNFLAPDVAKEERGIRFAPKLEIEDIDAPWNFTPVLSKAVDSVDILSFEPHCMDNNVYSIRTSVELSTMTMGQDQRHRTISRGKPQITGDFYLPPLLQIAGLQDKAEKFRKKWIDLKTLGVGVMQFVVPYGAMVKYQKRSNINALLHEQAKRLCWCAQEEIYNLNIQLARQLQERCYHDLAYCIAPPCKYGKCIEGARSCGRDLTVWQKDAMAGFAQRQI